MANPLRRIYQKLESISCLCAEGPEFMGKLQIADAIQKEALSALAICKSVLQPVVQADACLCPNGSLCEFFEKENETCLYGKI